jgi:threonine/homoserine/homoserine lactone efflux protein
MQAVLGFAAIAAILTVIPGSGTTLVLRPALARTRTAAVTAFGIACGAMILGWRYGAGEQLLYQRFQDLFGP